MSLIALLGNSNPQMQEDGSSVPAEHLNQSVTRVEFGEHVANSDETLHALSTNNDRILSMIARSLGGDLKRWAVAVSETEQIMSVHSAGDAPDWVSVIYEETPTIVDPDSGDALPVYSDPSDAEELEEAIAKHFGCARGEPTNLLTNAGRDMLHAQHMSTSTQPASCNYIALTANATAASASSTSLTAEIATASGGLVRAQATYAHTGGTNTTTLTKTFTANGSDSLPVTVAKIGVFNASSSGTLGYETLLNATATLTISGDNVTVTETVTAG